MNWFGNTRDFYGKKWFSAMELAYPQLFRHYKSEIASATLIKAKITHNRLAVIISGGGSDGPLLPGLVGDGLADACVIGAPYSAPNAYAIYEVAKELGSNEGVLLLFNNFMGDYLNNDMAAELLRLEGYQVEVIPIYDDMGMAIGEPKENRGGRCALPYLLKLAAGAAEDGKSLEEVAALVRKACERVTTLCVVINTEENEASFGNGFSGEPSFQVIQNTNMFETAEEIIRLLLLDVRPSKDEKIYLLVNRLRLTSYADSYIFAGYLHQILSKDYSVEQLRVGAYSNILDEYGYTVSLFCANVNVEHYMDVLVSGDGFLL